MNYLINKKFIILQLFGLIVSISLILKDKKSDFELISGNIYLTDSCRSSWQFINNKFYNNVELTDIYNLSYRNIININQNGSFVSQGYILLFDGNELSGIFKGFSIPSSKYSFINEFKKEIKDDNIYNIELENDLLKIHYKECYNNTYLKNEADCFFSNNTYNDINMFLNYYFYEKLKLPNYFYKSYYNDIYTLILDFLKISLMFMVFNISIYILYIYIKVLPFNFQDNEYIPLN